MTSALGSGNHTQEKKLETHRSTIQGPLGIEAPANSPLWQFESLFNRAREAQEAYPEAFSLATVRADLYPDNRIVLLKGFNGSRPLFFTNYDSDKGQQLALNPRVAMTFHWKSIKYQVRMLGVASKTARSISEQYFNSRPLDSQVAAILSQQSRHVDSYEVIHQQFTKEVERTGKLKGQALPCPQNWGGYEVEIDQMEIWEDHPDRFHKRVLFSRSGIAWSSTVLWP